MIQIDSGMVAIIITVLVALLGLAVGYGTLREKVRKNRDDIDKFIENNREDHERIYNKIDEVNEYLRNSKG